MGTVVKVHGLRGEVVVLPATDNERRFVNASKVHTAWGQILEVRSAKSGDRGLLLSFAEIGDRNQAEDLVGAELFVAAAARRSLDHDEFWPDQLIGLEVHDEGGALLGRVNDVDDTTSQARLVISGTHGQFEVPFVDDLVPLVDIDGGYLVIRLVAGLFD